MSKLGDGANILFEVAIKEKDASSSRHIQNHNHPLVDPRWFASASSSPFLSDYPVLRMAVAYVPFLLVTRYLNTWTLSLRGSSYLFIPLTCVVI